MLTTEALTAAIARLHYPSIEEKREDRAAHLAAVQAYRTAEAALVEEWKEWLAEEYAPSTLTMTKKRSDAIFEKAYEQGHSEGYRAVEHAYEDLSDFLGKILGEAVL